MDHEHGYQNTTPRRSFLRAVGGAVATGTLVSTAGCLDLIFGRSGPGATVPGGDIPTTTTITEDEADVAATSPGELRSHVSASDGRIIWIPNGVEIDMTGQDLTLNNVVVASGRSDGTPGGAIRTEDEGSDSPAWDGGDNHRGLIECQDNSSLLGVRILGPHHSEQDHHALPGYIPFQDGPSKSARDAKRAQKYARGVSITGDNVTISNCELAYFGYSAITVGHSASTPVETEISFSHLHNCCMDALGYGVDVKHGDPLVYQCYFDAMRHAVNGSGRADSSYRVIETDFGPWFVGHITDQHAVKENESGSSSRSATDYRHRAGGRMLVRGCRFMTPRVADLPFISKYAGNQTPHATVRAVPSEGFFFEENQCSHSDISSGISQRGVPGSYPTDEHGFTRIYISDNTWGVSFSETENVP